MVLNAQEGTAPKPLYDDPIYHGAADPVVIFNKQKGKWWMFYTNRRASIEDSTVQWVHGTRIGIAESNDGINWTYLDTANINYRPDAGYTHWAPDIIENRGTFHMYLTYVPGIFKDWNHPRVIVHLTSKDLKKWDYQSTLKLVNEKVIDASVYKVNDNLWRLWYNNERDGKSIYYADSKDLYNWEDKGKAIAARGEGPKVFYWHNKYFMIIDAWKGMEIYSSNDLLNWSKQSSRILENPGKGKDDQAIGGHCEVVVNDGRAFVYYFTHPGRKKDQTAPRESFDDKRSVIQLAELHYVNGEVVCDRDEKVTYKLKTKMNSAELILVFSAFSALLCVLCVAKLLENQAARNTKCLATQRTQRRAENAEKEFETTRFDWKRLFILATMFLLVIQASAQQKELQYLSGTDAEHTVQWDFFLESGRNSKYWTKINVPSCWEQEGFGNYNYGRDNKTNGKNFKYYSEVGKYKYQFRISPRWKGKRINIVFDGSMTDTEVFINGKRAGEIHKGAFYRFKYDITSLLSFDKPNTLEVTVSKMSDDASVNNAERLADYWIFGGIFRPVFLEATPTQWIDYLGIDAKHDGSFAMKIKARGLAQNAFVVATITDANKKVITTVKKPISKIDGEVVLSEKIQNIKQWTSETPDLYKAHVVLQDAAGKKLYELTEKFGFRTIEIRRGQGIFINGTQVKFKGVNRHCFWPETGRTLSKKQELMDALLIKEMNMNAVRCSHYPPDKYFLELCDSLGIYVLNELAGWQKAYSAKAGEPLVKELVLRDLNHPSIIFWSNGNEGGTNKELDDDFDMWDFQKRPVIHAHHRPGNHHNGIDCNHYEDYYSTEKILNDSLIYMPTEMLHAQDDGGGGAAMEDFWNLHWNAKRSGGVFIWAMVDESVVRTDLNNALDANGLNGNDGILGPHREKEGSYYALRKIFSPIQLNLPDLLPASFNGEIEIENRFHFLNINQCSFTWALADFFGPGDEYARTLKFYEQKRYYGPDISPLNKGVMRLQLPADFKNHDALVITATDNCGKEIYSWTTLIKSNAELVSGIIGSRIESESLKETDTVYALTGGEITITLEKKTGNLISIRNPANDYQLSFKNGPVLADGTSSIVTSSRTYKEGVTIVIEFSYSGMLKWVKWKMNGNGWVSMEYEYNAEGDKPFSGISFNYPENYVLAAKWLGKGPARQWKNRFQGTEINVWQNLYNNTHTGYSPIVYPEFKGYYGEVAWMELSTVQGKFVIATPDSGLFVRLFDFYALSSDNKPHPELPVGNISFLDCIPPIGTKLAMGLTTNTKVYGPMSELNHLSGSKRRTLYFYFGLIKN